MSICSVSQCHISETVLEANSSPVLSEPPSCSTFHGWRSLPEPEKICCVACFSEGSLELWKVCLMGLQPKCRVTQCTGGQAHLRSPPLLFSLSGTAAAIEETARASLHHQTALVHSGKFRHLLSYSSPGLYHIGAISLSDLKAQGRGRERGVFVQLPQLLLSPQSKEVLEEGFGKNPAASRFA